MDSHVAAQGALIPLAVIRGKVVAGVVAQCVVTLCR